MRLNSALQRNAKLLALELGLLAGANGERPMAL
jgi:hypothetical protein